MCLWSGSRSRLEEEYEKEFNRPLLTTLRGSIFYPSFLHVFFKLYEKNTKSVDDPEDNSIDEEAADEDEPCPTSSIWRFLVLVLLTGSLTAVLADGSSALSHERGVWFGLHPGLI